MSRYKALFVLPIPDLIKHIAEKVQRKYPKTGTIPGFRTKCGGPEETRTLDLSDANRTLSQLSYRPRAYVL